MHPRDTTLCCRSMAVAIRPEVQTENMVAQSEAVGTDHETGLSKDRECKSISSRGSNHPDPTLCFVLCYYSPSGDSSDHADLRGTRRANG